MNSTLNQYYYVLYYARYYYDLWGVVKVDLWGVVKGQRSTCMHYHCGCVDILQTCGTVLVPRLELTGAGGSRWYHWHWH